VFCHADTEVRRICVQVSSEVIHLTSFYTLGLSGRSVATPGSVRRVFVQQLHYFPTVYNAAAST